MSKFINRVGEIGYNNQGEKMTIIRCSKLKGDPKVTIDVQFEDGEIAKNKSYTNFKRGAIKHPIKYEDTIAYYIEVELGLNIDEIWDWKKNNDLNINPYNLTYGSSKKIWIKCQNKKYHGSYEVACKHFHNGSGCPYCFHIHGKVHYFDSLGFLYHNIAKMIVEDRRNNLTYMDTYSICPLSEKRYYYKCLKCEKYSDKAVQLNILVKNLTSCKFCSDGISIPNKFMGNILKQLNEEFITELSSKEFSGKNYFYYDFYLPKHKMIIEMNGLQHYEECSLTKRSLFEEQWNDLFKYKCAKNYVDDYIVIDCRYSTLEWMKENIIKELSDYFDLSNINWELAWKESQSSLCVKAWELYNNGIHSTLDIGNILNLNDATIRDYLKKGKEIGVCNYSKENSKKSRIDKIKNKRR